MQDFAEGKLCSAFKEGRKSKLNPLQAAFVKQMVRIMKLTSILLLAAFLHVSARGYTQGNVTLNMKNAPLEEVLKKIREETGYNFFYQVALLDKAHKVDIIVKNVSIKEALDICFKDQPLTYTVTGNTVVVRLRTEEPKAMPQNQLNGDVKGRVINDKGEPLAGANVVIKRTGKGTITDANGNFSLTGITNDDLLIVSYVGYQPQSIRVDRLANLILTLAVANNELDETIVQAYGTTTRRLATGNIVKVSAAEIERQPVMNPLLALQGKVAGLDVKQINGYTSATIKVELRGRPNINSNFTSDPLYIVDGVPLTVLNISPNATNLYQSGSTGFLQSGNNGPAGGQSPLFSINPNDIQSVEVLKDADATAIYGSRGANGVILITTKKGKPGKTKFDLHIQQGITKVTRYYDLMNTPQYLQMRREALRNDGITPSLQNGDYDLLQWDTTRYTNWQRFLYGGTGKTIDLQGALSGGNPQTNFRVGIGYNRMTNILTVSGADQRASVSFNLSHATLNQKLQFNFSSNYSFTQSDMINLSGSALSLPPNAPPVYDSVGNLNWSAWGDLYTSARNSFNFYNLKRPYTAKTNFLNTNFSINYKPFKGLSIGSSFGYNSAQANQEDFTPIASQDPASGTVTGSSNYGYNTNKNWIVEPQMTYSTFLSKGKLDVLIAGSVQQTNTNTATTVGIGFTSDLLLKNLSSAAMTFGSNGEGEYKYAALFGRITYNWENKYLLNLSARRDGSSRFGEGKQYGNFSSVGVGWIFKEESLFKCKALSFISFGKLRGSYGITGNDGVGDYGYLTRWSGDGTQPYQGTSVLRPLQHANPTFHWSVNKKMEGGIDLGFFDNRINVSVSYYRNRCGDQLVSFPTPNLSGFTSVVANWPALVQNSGWEFIASATVITRRNFRWTINFNTAINRNKLISYPNFELSPYTYFYQVGQPLNMARLLHYTGVDPVTGEYTFEDKNHDGTISTFNSIKDQGDTYFQNLNPKFMGGLGMDFTYKAFQLNLFFNIKDQVGTNALMQLASPAGLIGNQPVSLIGKEWQKTGDAATVAKFTTQSANSNYFFGLSDGLYTNASFIRLSNLAFSYNLPASWIKKLGLQACSLYLHANNIFVITKYKGTDPETQNFGGLPPVKIIVCGVNLNF